MLRSANALFAAKSLSETIVSVKGAADLDQTVNRVTKTLGLDPRLLAATLGELPAVFAKHCAAVEVTLPSLPDFVAAYGTTSGESSAAPPPVNEDRFAQFAEEIREAVKSREPPASIITTVMETCAWGLDFTRVILLLVSPSRKTLVGRMALGSIPNFDPKTVQRSIEAGLADEAPDAAAFSKGMPIFRGDPILPDGWPIAAIPVGFGSRCIGVIYADRVDTQTELTPREQASIGLLAELLDRAIAGRG